MTTSRELRPRLLGWVAAMVASSSVYFLRDYQHSGELGMLLGMMVWGLLISVSMMVLERVVEPRLARLASAPLRSALQSAWMLVAVVLLAAIYAWYMMFLLTRPVVWR